MQLPAGWYNFYYHDVSRDPRVPAAVRTSPERFDAEMRFLKHHFEVVAFDQGLRRLQDGQLDRAYASVSFDDGYCGVLEHALPVLAREQVPHTLFLNSAFLDGTAVSDSIIAQVLQQDGNALRACMHPQRYAETWSRVKRQFDWHGLFLDRPSLSRFPAGLTQFGNHTRHHYWLAGLSRQDQESEIAGNHELLRHLPGYVSLLALPFGTSDCFDDTTLAVNDAVHGNAVIKAVGGIGHRLEQGRWIVERMNMSDEKPRIDDVIRLRVTGRDLGYRLRKFGRNVRRWFH